MSNCYYFMVKLVKIEGTIATFISNSHIDRKYSPISIII